MVDSRRSLLRVSCTTRCLESKTHIELRASADVLIQVRGSERWSYLLPRWNSPTFPRSRKDWQEHVERVLEYFREFSEPLGGSIQTLEDVISFAQTLVLRRDVPEAGLTGYRVLRQLSREFPESPISLS